jgi:hypothetical protein
MQSGTAATLLSRRCSLQCWVSLGCWAGARRCLAPAWQFPSPWGVRPRLLAARRGHKKTQLACRQGEKHSRSMNGVARRQTFPRSSSCSVSKDKPVRSWAFCGNLIILSLLYRSESEHLSAHADASEFLGFGDHVQGFHVVAEAVSRVATIPVAVTATDTDDRGEYRLAGLPPDIERSAGASHRFFGERPAPHSFGSATWDEVSKTLPSSVLNEYRRIAFNDRATETGALKAITALAPKQASVLAGPARSRSSPSSGSWARRPLESQRPRTPDLTGRA